MVPNLRSPRKPDSSPPERPGLDNVRSQSWSEATCPCTTSASAYLRFVTIFLLEKTRQSTRSGGTGASCVRTWLTRAWHCLDQFVPEGIRQVSRRSEVGNTKWCSLNTRLSSGTSAGTFAVSTGPYKNYHAKAGKKNEPWHVFGTISNKRVGKSIITFRTLKLVAFFFKGFRSTLNAGRRTKFAPGKRLSIFRTHLRIRILRIFFK